MLGLKLIHVSKRGHMSSADAPLLNCSDVPVHKNARTCKVKVEYLKQLPLPVLGLVYSHRYTVYPKKYAHSFCFAVLCCGYTLTDLPISIRFTSLALWQSDDCPSASTATLMNMDKYFPWIHYERLHNHNKAKHNKTVCIFLGIYCNSIPRLLMPWLLACQGFSSLALTIEDKLSIHWGKSPISIQII